MQSQLNPLQPRNLQLDFFRGIALMIIFINHIPGNPWFWFTPSRFGLSDAAETFVFLSGFASALAYGRCFDRAGLWLGSVRVLHRCGQIYAAHLASFWLLAMICVAGNRWSVDADYVQRLNIGYFFDDTQHAVFDLFRLAYIPHYFDILPLYLLLLLWLPVIWGLSRFHHGLAMACSVAIYVAAWQYGWELTADPADGRPWFFNPFTWQLMFFTGFAVGNGWIRIPDKHWGGLLLCAAIVVLSIPLGHEAIYRQVVFWGDLRNRLEPLIDKSHLGILRWVHLLALAYLMNQLFKWQSHWLAMTWSRYIIRMGQQSLPIFLCCMSLSYMAGMVLDGLGRTELSVALVNLSGMLLMLLFAQFLAWLDSKPWTLANTEYRLVPNHDAVTSIKAISCNWGQRALILSLLCVLALSPLLLMQTQNPSVSKSAETELNLPNSVDFKTVKAVKSIRDAEYSLQNQQGF